MGMDARLVKCRNLKQPEQQDFWNNCITTDAWHEYKNKDRPAVLWYGRKNWDLHNEIFGNDYECGEWVEVTKETLDKMLDFAAHNPDYFGDFETVPSLCRARYYYDTIHEAGWIFAYECDW